MIPRSIRHAVYSAARLLFVALLVFTSFYSVLAYVPDTYIAFIQAPFQAWIPQLIRLHPYIFAVLAAVVAIALWSESERDQDSQRLVLEFIFIMAAAAVYFFLNRPLVSLRSNSRSFVWALAAIFPILWIGVLDWRTYWRRRDWSGEATPRFGVAFALLTALAISVLYPLAAFVRYRFAGLPPYRIHGVDLLVDGGAIAVHILFFAVFIGLLMLSESLAWRTRQPRKVRFVLFTAIAWLAIATAMERVAFAAIPFRKTESLVYSVFFGFAWSVFGGSLLLRAQAREAGQLQPASRQRRRVEGILLGVVLFLAACVVPAMTGIIDWNNILEKIWVLIFWTAVAFTVDRLIARPSRPLPLPVALAAPVLAYSLYTFGLGSQRWYSPDSPLQEAISLHSTYDVSYATVRDLLATDAGFPCDDNCRYFHEQTNIPPSMPPAAPQLGLVEDLKSTAGPKPNIFIFVIDSLRQDYLTPYNTAVDYTPELAAFARESLVFRNAFSRYAGTTLSEPSIWAGAMLLHTHYVQPFSRVNNLEKLIKVDGYESYVTVDTTLHALLDRHDDIVGLDQNVASWNDIDLCTTAREAETKISNRRDATRPIFIFTQPQNVHLLTVQKRHPELLVRTKEALAQVYAQDLRRLDGCFGDFMGFLKRSGLYSNSIIVVTADHGELGHDSHASSVEPDIMRVPLLIHLPEDIRKRYAYDTSKVAFTIDVTPTLYYLLGHRPIRNDEVLGRPLITATAAEAVPYERDSYLLASSYTPNYGILRENGRMFFAFDDAKHTQALYDLSSDPDGNKNLLTAPVAAVARQNIHDHIAQIAAAYSFRYKRTTLLTWLLH